MPLSDSDAAQALEAWVREHLGSAERQAAVRGVADRLEDLQDCEYDDLEETLELSSWPAMTRKRFVEAWRRLKADAAPAPPVHVTPDPPRGQPLRRAGTTDAADALTLIAATLPRGSSSVESEPDDDAWAADARELLREIKDEQDRNGYRAGLEGLRAMLTRYGFSGPSPPWRSPCDISVPANFPAAKYYLPKSSLASGKLRSLATLERYLERALGDDAADDAPAPETSGDEEEASPPRAASATASTAGDEALARRLAMGLPPRRSTGRGAAAAPLPAPPPRKSAKAQRPREASDDDSDDDESSDDDVPISVWQAQAAAEQPAPAKPWAVGDRVEAKFLTAGQVGSASARYSREFYPSTITAIHGATCDVEYDTSDEETEEHLPLRHVRKRRRARGTAGRGTAQEKEEEEEEEGAGEDARGGPGRRAVARPGALPATRHPVLRQCEHGVDAAEARGRRRRRL